MKKTITIYELLGLIKDGKAPKKIKWGANILYFDTETSDYLFSEKDEMYTDRFFYGWGCCNEKTSDWLNSYVIILDEEEFEYIQGLENEKEFYCYTEYEKYKNDIDKILYILKAINITEEKIDNLNNQINQLIKNQKKIIERLK